MRLIQLLILLVTGVTSGLAAFGAHLWVPIALSGLPCAVHLPSQHKADVYIAEYAAARTSPVSMPRSPVTATPATLIAWRGAAEAWRWHGDGV